MTSPSKAFCAVVVALALLAPSLALVLQAPTKAKVCRTVTCDRGLKGSGGRYNNCTADCINGAVCPKGQQVCAFDQCFNATLAMCYSDSVLCTTTQQFCSPQGGNPGGCYDSTQTCQSGVVCAKGLSVCGATCYNALTDACTAVGVCPKAKICSSGKNGPGGCLADDQTCLGGLVCMTKNICGSGKNRLCNQGNFECKRGKLLCGKSDLTKCIDVQGNGRICRIPGNSKVCFAKGPVYCVEGSAACTKPDPPASPLFCASGGSCVNGVIFRKLA